MASYLWIEGKLITAAMQSVVEEEGKMERNRGRPKKSAVKEKVTQQEPVGGKKRRGRPRLNNKEEEKEEDNEKLTQPKPAGGKKRRGRPRLNNKEEGKEDNEKVTQPKPAGKKKRRGRPRLNYKEEGKQEDYAKVTQPKPAGEKKRRERPRLNYKEEENVEIENHEVEDDLNNASRDGELAGDVEAMAKAKDLSLDCMGGVEGAVEENAQSRVKDEEVKLRKRQRCQEVGNEASGCESEVIGRVVGSETKKKRRGRKPSKSLEKHDKEEAGFKENAGESKVNKDMSENKTKKRRGRKPSKGLGKQQENDGVDGDCFYGKEREQEEGEMQDRKNCSNHKKKGSKERGSYPTEKISEQKCKILGQY